MFPKYLERDGHYYYRGTHFFTGEHNRAYGFCERDYQRGMHEQDFYEVNIIMSGRGVHYIGDKRVDAVGGDVFIIPPYFSHGYAGEKGFDVYHVLLSDSFMENNTAELREFSSFHTLFKAEPMMRRMGGELFHLSLGDGQMESIREVLSSLERYRTPESAAAGVIRNSYASLLIALLCRIYEENNGEAEKWDAVDRGFMEALTLIHTRYSEKLTISLLSKTAKLSRSSFIRRFREVCGMPPTEYIIKTRLEAAEDMLVNGSLSVSEIALRTGFYDTSHFSTHFKEKNGVSPGRYRELKGKQTI